MIYVTALASVFLLAAGIAVIVGMIRPNLALITDALFGYQIREPALQPISRRSVGEPRVVAIRQLLRAAA